MGRIYVISRSDEHSSVPITSFTEMKDALDWVNKQQTPGQFSIVPVFLHTY